MADAPSRQSSRRRSLIGRLILFVLLPLVLLVGVVVVLGPTIASSMAPGFVASAAKESINGSASVSKVRLRWRGPQEIAQLSVKDEAGTEILRADVSASTSLLSLVFGSRDIGEVRVSGSALVVKDSSGQINFAKLAKAGSEPPPGHAGGGGGGGGGGSGEPVELPESLAAKLVIDELAVTYADESRTGTPGGALGLWALKGEASFAVGQPLVTNLAGVFVHGGDARSAKPDGGTLSIKGTVNGLTDASGTLTPAAASGDFEIALKNLSTEGIDALLDQQGNLTGALGERVALDIKASGSAQSGAATLVATSDAVTADIALALRDNTLTVTRQGVITARSGKLIAMAPDLRAQLSSEQTMVVQTWPDVRATLDTLSVKIPTGGAPIDLRGAALSLTLATTETGGKVAIPGADGVSTVRPFGLSPLNLTLGTPDLAQGLTLKGGAAATIDGAPAGTLGVDALVSGVIDERGAPVAGMPAKLAATLDIKDFATAIAEPLVAGANLRLAEDVGPTLSARVVANSTAIPGQKLPRADVTLEVDAANIRSSGAITLADNVVTSGADGLAISILSAGPIAERFLTASGLDIIEGASVTCTIKDLRADLAKLAPPADASGTKPAPDLRALRAVATVGIGQTRGSMKLPGEPQRTPFTVLPTTLVLDASDLAKSAKLSASGSAFMAGSPAGTLKAELAAGVLDASGAPVKGIPADLNATFSLRDASTKALQPLASKTGLILSEDLGEKLNIEGWAKPGATPGRTDVSFSANAQKLQVGGQLDLSPTEIRTREQGLKLTAQDVGRILGRFAPAEQATFEPTGTVQVLVQDVALPLDAGAGGLRLDKAGAKLSVSASGVRASLKTPDGGAQPFNLGSTRLAAALAPGAAPTLNLDSTMSIGSKPSIAKGALTINNLFAADGAINAAGARPEGTIELADVPTVLASFGGKEIADLVTEALGQTVSAKVDAAQKGDATAVNLAVNAASGTTLASTATLTPTELSIGATSANAAVSPALLRTLAKGNPSVPALSAPAKVNLAVEPFAIPLKDASIDATRLVGKRLKATIDASADIADVVIAGSEPGAAPMRTGPIKAHNIRVVADAPLAAIAPASDGAKAERATIQFNAPLTTSADEPLASIVANADLGLKGQTPDGAVRASLRADNVSAAFIDGFINQPGMLAGAVGDRFQAAASLNLPKIPTNEDLQNLAMSVRVSSGRVTFSDVATVRVKPDRIELASPVTIDWKPSPEWATRYMLAQESGPGTPAPALRFTQGPPIKVTLSSATFASGKDASGRAFGPFKPGVFALDAGLDIPATTVVMADGQNITLKDLSASLKRNPADPQGLAFQLRTVPSGSGAQNAKPVTFDGTLTGLADASGNPTPDKAALTAKGRVAGLPTALVDSIADQNGMLVELLGPVINMDLDANGLSKVAGSLAAVLTSERATATVKGRVQDGLFIADTSTGAKVASISPALGAKLTEGLPLIGSLEKRPPDAPATLTTASLRVPTSTKTPEDLRKLNGQMTLDLGEVRFQTGGAFQSILKAVGQKDEGTAGRRLQPLQVNITDGVVKYQRFELPIGEFNVDTEGSYDLVTKRVDFITWIPAGALADEAAGLFNTGLGGLLGGSVKPIEKLTMLPWRTSGTAGGSISTKPDLELFIKSTGQNLIREPGKILEGGLNEILKNLPGKNGG